jgi:hypothetical protein
MGGALPGNIGPAGRIPSDRLRERLLVAAVVMIAMLLLLQGITCWSLLRLAHQPVRVDVQNPTLGVNVQNRTLSVEVENSTLSVEVENSELDVQVRDHWILDGDPIPVRIVQ